MTNHWLVLIVPPLDIVPVATAVGEPPAPISRTLAVTVPPFVTCRLPFPPLPRPTQKSPVSVMVPLTIAVPLLMLVSVSLTLPLTFSVAPLLTLIVGDVASVPLTASVPAFTLVLPV